ncbi:ABC transporter ATP-binding protein [Sinomonas susongensis]|uniref:ABC transporter ATP-binding protein n=1 Tax=Sinomonas susongensis TaxID=1324851 RepID=UPI0014866CDF|nr:ABC transporter ATP-binding protein [Sinomonas susongensis]
MSGHPIVATGLGKRYGKVEALSGIDLDVAAGEFLVLLGPSGSGKSTLLRAIAGVERPDSGRLQLAGATVDDERTHVPSERRDLGMVFQDYALWPHLTVEKNVAFALRRRRLTGAEASGRTREALETVGLAELAHRYPSDLSGGQQQRVALARAIVSRPGLLLFDEPLSNLDADLRERLRVEIAAVTRLCGATAVYITHDQSEAFALADRIGVLEKGRLVQLDRPEEVYRQPASPFVARFTGTAGELPGRVLDPGGHHVVLDVAGARLRARALGMLRAGDAATVLVRPDAATLTPVFDRADMPAVVTDVAYRGRGYEHAVRTEAGILTGLHASTRFERGTTLGLRLSPDGCHAHPVTERGIKSDDMNVTTVSFEPRSEALPQGRRPAL